MKVVKMNPNPGPLSRGGAACPVPSNHLFDWFACLLMCLLVGQAQGQVFSTRSMSQVAVPVGLPLQQEDFDRVSSGYGWRSHPLDGAWKFHHGIDLVAGLGSPVYASAMGVVEVSEWDPKMGHKVIVSHKHGFKTLYGHLALRNVQERDTILMGGLVGYVGSTGRVTGPHLHFEIWFRDVRVDPKPIWRYMRLIKGI